MAVPLSIPLVAGGLAIFSTTALVAVHGLVACDGVLTTAHTVAIVSAVAEGVVLLVLCGTLYVLVRRRRSNRAATRVSQAMAALDNAEVEKQILQHESTMAPSTPTTSTFTSTPASSPAPASFGGKSVLCLGLCILLVTLAAAISIVTLAFIGKSAHSGPSTILIGSGPSGATPFLAGASVTLAICFLAQLLFLVTQFLAGRAVRTEAVTKVAVTASRVEEAVPSDSNEASVSRGMLSRPSLSRLANLSTSSLVPSNRIKSVRYSQTTASPPGTLSRGGAVGYSEKLAMAAASVAAAEAEEAAAAAAAAAEQSAEPTTETVAPAARTPVMAASKSMKSIKSTKSTTSTTYTTETESSRYSETFSSPASTARHSVTETMSSLRSSLSKSVRPITSKTRLMASRSRSPSTRSRSNSANSPQQQTPRRFSSRVRRTRSATTTSLPAAPSRTVDDFDSWDTSSVSPQNRKAVLESATSAALSSTRSSRSSSWSAASLSPSSSASSPSASSPSSSLSSPPSPPPPVPAIPLILPKAKSAGTAAKDASPSLASHKTILVGRFLETIPASPTTSGSSSPGTPLEFSWQQLERERPQRAGRPGRTEKAANSEKSQRHGRQRSRSFSPGPRPSSAKVSGSAPMAATMRSKTRARSQSHAQSPMLSMPEVPLLPPSFSSFASFSPPSPSGSEAHIHPLFRSDSPTPPPAVSAGTVVTAAPDAGKVIAADAQSLRTLHRMRSGSLPVVPSPLSRQGSVDDLGAQAAAAPGGLVGPLGILGVGNTSSVRFSAYSSSSSGSSMATITNNTNSISTDSASKTSSPREWLDSHAHPAASFLSEDDAYEEWADEECLSGGRGAAGKGKQVVAPPTERKMTPPIPDWILSAGTRTSLMDYESRKMNVEGGMI